MITAQTLFNKRLNFYDQLITLSSMSYEILNDPFWVLHLKMDCKKHQFSELDLIQKVRLRKRISKQENANNKKEASHRSQLELMTSNSKLIFCSRDH